MIPRRHAYFPSVIFTSFLDFSRNFFELLCVNTSTTFELFVDYDTSCHFFPRCVCFGSNDLTLIEGCLQTWPTNQIVLITMLSSTVWLQKFNPIVTEICPCLLMCLRPLGRKLSILMLTLQNDLEVGGASISFPPVIDPAPSHNSSRKTNMAAPIDDDNEHWKRLFFLKPTNTESTHVEEAINCRI